MAASFFDIEYTDPDGKPRKARTQAVNGLHTVELLQEHFDRHKQFGAGAKITKITKLTDTAQLAEAAATRPELPPDIIRNIQAAENAGGVSPGQPTEPQPAPQA